MKQVSSSGALADAGVESTTADEADADSSADDEFGQEDL